ncbi:MAG: PD-(D/E)XK nuclease family protein [Parcubacteria group bacterium]|nr:PD-(D/E)XK nuclease family protein [Parcubacteria group bacterium]
MSRFYTSRRSIHLYDPRSAKPFPLSRSKIELFVNCPRCFYLDRRLGVAQPPSFPFKLNSAVDTLLKKEFDIHRARGTPHPLMETYGIDAVPYEHGKMDEWRDALGGGVRYIHEPTHFLVTGGVDDIWINPAGELIVVDYKATSKNGEITINAEWQQSYKRQIEVYQWLLRKNDFRVSQTGYFVYCNGSTDREAFDGKLEFDVTIIPYEGDDRWVEGVLHDARACLMSDTLPEIGKECDYCQYRKAAQEVMVKYHTKKIASPSHAVSTE